MNFLAQKRSNIFLQQKKPVALNGKSSSHFDYEEIASLAELGSWWVDLRTKECHMDDTAKKLLKLPHSKKPTLDEMLSYHAPFERERAAKIFLDCSSGLAYNTTIKLIDFENNEFWVKAMGKPIYENATIVGIRGVFRNIHEDKLAQNKIKDSLANTESQNERLVRFANLLSHNLRSQASNLQLTVELLRGADSSEEVSELNENLDYISKNLATTITHMDKLVSIQSKASEEKKTIVFSEALEQVKQDLQNELIEAQAELFTDFSEVPSIAYIPSFIQDILTSLMSNSIKYRMHDRKLVIEIYTYRENDRTYLMVKDNGVGIDMERKANNLFNYYHDDQPFDHPCDVGLFIIKNEIEALHGNITVESTLSKGTTVKIAF